MRHTPKGLSLQVVPEKGQQIPHMGTPRPCVATGSGQGWAASWTAAARCPHLGWAWPLQVLECEAPAQASESLWSLCTGKWPEPHPWAGANQGSGSDKSAGAVSKASTSPGTWVQLPGHFTQQASPGRVGARGGSMALYLRVDFPWVFSQFGQWYMSMSGASSSSTPTQLKRGSTDVASGQQLLGVLPRRSQGSSQSPLGVAGGSMHAGGVEHEPGQWPTGTGGDVRTRDRGRG